MSFLAIVNPAAGGGRCGRAAAAALDQLRQAGLQIEVFETSAAGQARDRVREACAAGHLDFLAVGGDGTAFEIVNGMFAVDRPPDSPRPSLGFLPLGTGNSFLRDFTDRGAEYAVEAMIQGKRRACDVIRVHHTQGVLHFINIFSIGFVADVGATRNRRFSHLGELGYTLSTVLRVADLHPYVFPLEIAGRGQLDCEPLTFLSINNSRFTGGKMMMAPAADTSDGLLDIIRVGRMGRLSLLRTFPKIFQGTHIHHPAVSCCQAPALDFHLEGEVDVMIDGEMLRLNPTRLEVLPAVLDVRT